MGTNGDGLIGFLLRGGVPSLGAPKNHRMKDDPVFVFLLLGGFEFCYCCLSVFFFFFFLERRGVQICQESCCLIETFLFQTFQRWFLCNGGNDAESQELCKWWIPCFRTYI